MESQNSPHKAGFIFVHHIRACSMCTIKARRFFLNQGLTNVEIQDFFDNRMPIAQLNQARTLDQYEATAQRRYSAANEFSRRVNIEREAGIRNQRSEVSNQKDEAGDEREQ